MTTILSFDVGIKNLAFCKGTVADSVLDIHCWQLVSLSSPKPSAPAIAEVLDVFTDLLDDVSLVVIEKQVRKNPKMIYMAAALEMYLHIRTVMQFQPWMCVHMPAWRRTQTTSGHKCSYTQRKKDSVAKAAALVTSSPWARVLSDARKRDDLADCLCQILTVQTFTRVQ